jgi:hypothetical protein
MPLYFARHKDDWGNLGLPRYLYERGIVALHFEPVLSWNPLDYVRSGRCAITYLNALNEGEEDAYVFASYNFKGQANVIRGQPSRGSKLFLRDFAECEIEAAARPPLKMLFLENVQQVSRGDFPLAYLLAPQRSTFVKWPSVERVAMPWLLNEPADLLNPASYLPASIEVACEEYLRLTDRLKSKRPTPTVLTS